ncbi:MAG: hypothetical protein ACTSYU_04860, partial [Promethearchaeota archaeon]
GPDSNDANNRHSLNIPGEQENFVTPRLGRRESEPHSGAISYLFDVIRSNFPNDRGFWDLHHYFDYQGEEIDIQYDISYFRNFQCPEQQPSYKAREFGGRIPTLTINVLSKSTYMQDLSVNLDLSLKIGVPLYVVFFAYPVAPRVYPLPFLRVYELRDNQYIQHELHEVYCDNENKINSDAILSFPDLIPFKIGLRKMVETYKGNKPIYQIALFDLENHIYPTKAEYEKQRAEQEKQRAEQEKQRAEQEKQKAEQEKQKAEQEKQKAEQEKQRAEQEKQRAEQEKQRAEQEKQRADILESKVKELEEKLK